MRLAGLLVIAMLVALLPRPNVTPPGPTRAAVDAACAIGAVPSALRSDDAPRDAGTGAIPLPPLPRLPLVDRASLPSWDDCATQLNPQTALRDQRSVIRRFRISFRAPDLPPRA